MLGVMFVSTFLAAGLLGLLSFQLLFSRRRAKEILQMRDASEQSATVVRTASLIDRGEEAFKQAGLTFPFRSYLMAAFGGILGGALLALAGAWLLALLLCLAVGGAPWLLVQYRKSVRAKMFADQLPAALTLAANTIRAGGTLLQAVSAVARDMPDPIGAEFARIKQSLQLQVPVGQALEQARQRIGVQQFTAVVVACKVAGQAGADLDVLLESISKEIVDDRQFQDAMKAASSEGRTSAKVVTAVPVLIGGFVLFSDASYFQPMLDSPLGRLLFIASAISIVVGWVVIKRITDVRAW